MPNADPKVAALMKLGMSKEEALQVIADDADIDHGKSKDFDLSAEQQKIARKYTRTGTRKGGTTAKPRKENPDKREIISVIDDALWPLVNNDLKVTNPERQIDFEYNGNSYSITLTQHRKPKGE